MAGRTASRRLRCAGEGLMADRDRRTGEQPDAGEGFLQRWSRRKVEARTANESAAGDPGGEEVQPAPSEQGSEPGQGEPAPVAPEDLPDIESLDASSDFSVFMRPGVPEHLRTQALRKLWRADPIFSKLDGLLEYGGDYTIPSWPKGTIRTAYQIGRGFVNELEKLGGVERPPEPAAPAAEPTDDAKAASVPVPADRPVEAGDPPERIAGSTGAQVGPASPAAGPAAAKPRPRALPRRG